MTEQSIESFGSYMKRRRTELGLTQQDVERNGGPAQTTISDYEAAAGTISTRIPSRRMVSRVARGLGVPLKEVEEAAGLLPGRSLPPLPHYPDATELEKSGRRAIRLQTGDVIYLAEDDPTPKETLLALEAWLTGWRQGISNRTRLPL